MQGYINFVCFPLGRKCKKKKKPNKQTSVSSRRNPESGGYGTQELRFLTPTPTPNPLNMDSKMTTRDLAISNKVLLPCIFFLADRHYQKPSIGNPGSQNREERGLETAVFSPIPPQIH